MFRPNFDPEDDEQPNVAEEESKQESTNSSVTKTEKVIKPTQDVWVDSDEDEEMEERREKNMSR